MKYYVTLTGLNYRFGTQPFAVGQKVKLVKEPENDFDREAIRAELPGLGKVGYVANSTHTVLGDCYSAGRIYDKIGAAATGPGVDSAIATMSRNSSFVTHFFSSTNSFCSRATMA